MPRDNAPTEHDLAIAACFTHLVGTCGYLAPRMIDEMRYACVMPLLFTHAIIVGRINDFVGYEDRWCFHSRDAALDALDAWDGEGEPEGWHRHPASGRRRKVIEGTPLEEWVNP